MSDEPKPDEPKPNTPSPKRGSLVDAFKAIRAAGGHAWDNIRDPAEYLGRKDVCLTPAEWAEIERKLAEGERLRESHEALTLACEAALTAIDDLVRRPMGVMPDSAYEAKRLIEAAILGATQERGGPKP